MPETEIDEERLAEQPAWVRNIVAGLKGELREAEIIEKSQAEALRLRYDAEQRDPSSVMVVQTPDDHRLYIPLDAVVLATISGDELDLSVKDGELIVTGIGNLYVRPVSQFEV